MCMPKKSAPLAGYSEVVYIALSWLNRTLGNVSWTISPTSPKLSNAMPVIEKYNYNRKVYLCKNNVIEFNKYQWMETLYLTWLTTFISTVSSSLAYIVGPGNLPLTVTVGLVEHSRVMFFITTYRQSFCTVRIIYIYIYTQEEEDDEDEEGEG